MAVGLAAAALGVITSSLPIAACAFLLTLAATIIPAEIAWRDCRRNSEEVQSAGVTVEELAHCLQAEGITVETGETRFQDMINSKPLPTGRTVH